MLRTVTTLQLVMSRDEYRRGATYRIAALLELPRCNEF